MGRKLALVSGVVALAAGVAVAQPAKKGSAAKPAAAKAPPGWSGASASST
jgi:hypothetical protein